MLRQIIASAVLLIMAGGVSSFAQSHRVEASAFGGWSFADGVSGNTIAAGDGRFYDRVDPKDSGLFGFSVGLLFGEGGEAGFMYSHANSSLVFGGAPLTGTPDREISGFNVTNYHGYFAYNFREVEARLRPFIYGGLGATNFGSVDFNVAGRQGSTGGNAQFSTTWGGGVKYYPHTRVGLRLGASWTPTYIKSDAAGYWCDPYWGCYLVGDPQYSNQFHLTGGVTFRF